MIDVCKSVGFLYREDCQIYDASDFAIAYARISEGSGHCVIRKVDGTYMDYHFSDPNARSCNTVVCARKMNCSFEASL